MIAIVDKLKRSNILCVDPEARELFNSIMESVPDYKLLTNRQFNNTPGLLNAFVEEFLNTFAYVEGKSGTRLPSYDPITVAYTEAETEVPKMPLHQWIALWTNAFIVYSEYPEAPEFNHFLMGIQNETYDNMIKVGKLNG